MILANSCSLQEKSVENNKDKVSVRNCYSEMYLKYNKLCLCYACFHSSNGGLLTTTHE